MITEIIKFDQVAFNYGKHKVFDGLSLSIQDGEYLGIIGPNGSGKTTFLKLLLGLLKPSKGTVAIMGKEPRPFKQQIGYVPQITSVAPDFPLQVKDVVGLGLIDKFSLFPWMDSSQQFRVQKALEKVRLKEEQHKKFFELSEGQRKRCFIARALIIDPTILLLDEPTAGLDPALEKELLEFFHELNKDLTILQVSHDLHFVSSHIKKVLCLSEHPGIHDTEQLTDDFIQSLYYGNKRLVHHDHYDPISPIGLKSR